MQWVIFDYYVNEFGTYVFISQRFCTVYFGGKKENAVNLTHSAQRKHVLVVKNKEKAK